MNKEFFFFLKLKLLDLLCLKRQTCIHCLKKLIQGIYRLCAPLNICLYNLDRTPPVISGCPQTVYEYAKFGEREAIVTWDEPTAEDDSGLPIRVARTHSPSTPFPLGPTRVVYYFTDNSENEAACSFFVQIREGTCLTYNIV